MAQDSLSTVSREPGMQAQMTQADRFSLPGRFSWNVSSGDIYWSEETYRIYELDPSLKPTLELARQRIHPEDIDFFNQTAHRARQEVQDFAFGHRLLMPDGTVKHVRVLFHAVTDESGELVEYIGAVLDVTGANNSQRALERACEETQNSKEQLRLAIDTIPGLVWTAQPDGHIDFLNQRWRDYTGLTLEEASGWGWAVAVCPADLPGLMDYWRSVLAAGEPGETEARLRRYDGEYRWFLFRAVPLYDELGKLVKWYGQTTDIDDRKRAEGLLAGEKRLLEMIAKGNPLPSTLDALCRLVEDTAEGYICGIVLVDASGARLQHGAAPSLPLSYNEAIHGRPVNLYSGPCAMAAYLKEQVIAADVASDTRWDSYEWRALAVAHGLDACWSTPILSLEGTVLGTFALYSRRPGDPTPQLQYVIEQMTHLAAVAIERKHAVEELRRSEAHLARAQSLSKTGSFSWRAESGELTLSDETYRICELDPAIKATVEMARDRIHPDDLPLLRQMLFGDGSAFSFDCRLQLPDESIKYLQVVADALRDDSGQLVEWVRAVRDVTERKLSEDTLHKVRAELAHFARVATLGELTASIAHEVNQPLAGIVTNASACLRWLAADPPNLEAARETAQRTIRDGNRAAEVITRLRALFKKKDTTNETLNLNEAIHEVIVISRSEVQKAKVALRTDLAVNLPLLVGDRVQLQQVVLNLILNATEAMSSVDGRPREMVISTRLSDDDCVQIAVNDTGVGLDPKTSELIFEAFYSSKREGMGMGLSISRSIVENHGGRLWAESNDGHGATFTFTIPLHRLSGQSLDSQNVTDEQA